MNRSVDSPINNRLRDVQNSSIMYVHQADKFHAEATHLSSLLEKSFLDAEQFINNRLQLLSSHNVTTGRDLDHERALLAGARAKLDTTRTKLAQCHQEAARLQANTDARFRLMSNTAKGRLEQVQRLALKMNQYETSLEIASPTTSDTDAILSKSDTSAARKFQEELRHVTEKLKTLIDLSKETRNETQILHGQYDTDTHRRIIGLMRHDKTEREQLSILIEHKQALQREIAWIREQKNNIDMYVTNMAPILDKCLCDGMSNGRPMRR